MSTSRAYRAKKQQVLQLKREHPKLTERELANLVKMSKTSVHNILAESGQNHAHMTGQPPSTDAGHAGQPPVSDQDMTKDDQGAALDFQDSPAPVESKSLMEQGWASLKGMLGIADKQEGMKDPAPLSGPLDAKRQAFVTNITPTASLAVMLVAAHMWSKLGPEYRVLAPKEDVARRIAEPLVRIYARHASFGIEVNPDIADLGASMFAIMGYIYTSLELYQVIKEKKEAEEAHAAEGSPNGYREYRTASTGGQNGASSQGGGLAPVSRPDYEDDRANGGHAGHADAIDRSHLTAKERAQFEALSALREQDYQSRLRRSGKAA